MSNLAALVNEFVPDQELLFLARGGVSDEDVTLESVGMISLMGESVEGLRLPFRAVMASGIVCTMNEATAELVRALDRGTDEDASAAVARWICVYVGAGQVARHMRGSLRGYFLEAQSRIGAESQKRREAMLNRVSFELAWAHPTFITGVDFDAPPPALDFL